jgi:RNA polymerase sigma-70 factor (ECF subfamily)
MAGDPQRMTAEKIVLATRDLSGVRLSQREEAAFAALLQRHGPMVLHVCRRVLGQIHDAEDVFQATFLMLAHKVRSLRKRDVVSSWLHGVAYRLAMQVREQARRRQVHELQAANLHRAEPTLVAAWNEVQAVLDEELRCLPTKYREVLMLCSLDGQTQEEVARQPARSGREQPHHGG